MISDQQWASFNAIVNDFSQAVNKTVVQWGRKAFYKGRYGEGNTNNYTFTQLNVLIQFNSFRTWPLTKHRDNGETDEQNMVIQINKQYLRDEGYLNSEGYFEFDTAEDIFVHKGIRYKAEADTPISQTQDDELFVWIVLLRQDIPTGGTYNDT